MTHAPLRIGTRASKLALAQAQKVQQALMQAHALPESAYEIVAMTTAGDREVHKNPAHWGYKGLFTKELEDALLGNRIDIAVHSMKDMPSLTTDGLALAAVLERADVRDAWISPNHASYETLPAGSVIGTSSARRTAQLLHHHPQVRVVPLRGNVQTRLSKLEQGEAEATFLACAGLERLGIADVMRMPVALEWMLPAVAQGAIGIECRADDTATHTAMLPLNHTPTSVCVNAERTFLQLLDGSCRTPIAGLAQLEGNQLFLRGEVLSLDGSIRHYREMRSTASDARALGEALGKELRALAGDALLSNIP